MNEEELLALYAIVRKEAESMADREAGLAQRTAALNQAIAKLEQLPLALGKQTSEYIAQGVRQAIQDDFRRPIADAVKGPIAELSRETYHARIIMEQVGRESRFQTWTWVTILVLLGIILGATGCYYAVVRDLDRVNDRLDAIQQQIADNAPAGPKQTDGKAAKRKKGGP